MNFPAPYGRVILDNIRLATRDLQEKMYRVLVVKPAVSIFYASSSSYEDAISKARTELRYTLHPTHPQFLERLPNIVRPPRRLIPSSAPISSNNTYVPGQALNTMLWAVPGIRDRLGPGALLNLEVTSSATCAVVAQVWEEKVAKILGCSLDDLPKPSNPFEFKDCYRGLMLLMYPLQNPNSPFTWLSSVDRNIKAATIAYLDSFTDMLGTRLELNLRESQNAYNAKIEVKKVLSYFLLIASKLAAVCVGSIAVAVGSGYLLYHNAGCPTMKKLITLWGTNAASGFCCAVAGCRSWRR